MAKFTLAYDEKIRGFTSFFSFEPDGMTRLGKIFYTFKDGQLYEQNDDDNPIKNNFYGIQYKSNIILLVNEFSEDDKIFKNLILESLLPWAAALNTNLTNSTIKKTEFNQHGSKWFAYVRKNEDTGNLTGISQGIGNIVSVNALTVTYAKISNLVSNGDVLYQMNGTTQEIIGTITNINHTTNTITVDAITIIPVPGRFSFAKKNSRVEGAEMRGYYLEIFLEDDSTDANELFAIRVNAVKSNL